MSKDAAMRAIREARYAASSARPTNPARRPAPVAPPVGAASDAPAPAVDARCGHRSMNGRTCTREQGHDAKSHRYG